MLCLMQTRMPATFFAGRANGHVADRLEIKLPFKIIMKIGMEMAMTVAPGTEKIFKGRDLE